MWLSIDTLYGSNIREYVWFQQKQRLTDQWRMDKVILVWHFAQLVPTKKCLAIFDPVTYKRRYPQNFKPNQKVNVVKELKLYIVCWDIHRLFCRVYHYLPALRKFSLLSVSYSVPPISLRWNLQLWTLYWNNIKIKIKALKALRAKGISFKFFLLANWSTCTWQLKTD